MTLTKQSTLQLLQDIFEDESETPEHQTCYSIMVEMMYRRMTNSVQALTPVGMIWNTLEIVLDDKDLALYITKAKDKFEELCSEEHAR